MRLATTIASAAMLCFVAAEPRAQDAEAGAQKAEACMACHGGNGVSIADEIPNLAAQKAKYIEAQLAAFLDGKRANPFMSAITSRLSKDDIPDIAAFFSGLPGAEPGAKSDPVPSVNATNVSFPADYKASFVHYHTINFADRGQVRRYFANKLAADAAKAGDPMPDGAVFFVEVHTAKKGADGKPETGADGFFVPEKLILHTAMEIGAGWGDDIPEILRNGDWHYAVFTTAGEKRPANHAACLACHIPQEANSYVFTLKELVDKVSRQ